MEETAVQATEYREHPVREAMTYLGDALRRPTDPDGLHEGTTRRAASG